MKFLLFAFTAALASAIPSPAPDIPTVTVIITVPPSSAPTTAAIVPQAQSTERQQQEDQPQPTTSATSSYARPSTSSTISDTITPSVQESASSQTNSEAASATTTASDTYYEPGQSNLGAGVVDTDAGASGSDAAAFRLSKGGLAGILIVVILVSLFGIASIILFIVAKRRQWTMRQTLKRASRRLTGRSGLPKTPQTASAANRRSRRDGIRMGSPPRPGVKAVYPPGHKRGLVVDVKDPEKGPQPLDGRAPKNTRPRENTWIKRVWGDGWK